MRNIRRDLHEGELKSRARVKRSAVRRDMSIDFAEQQSKLRRSGMEISSHFMSLLTELGDWEMDFCYKHIAPSGAPALRRHLFNRARWVLG